MRQQIARLIALAAMVLAAVLLRPAPALAETAVFATPGTVMPGDSTTVSAGCQSTATAATLTGTSFGGPSRLEMERDTSRGPGTFTVAVSVPPSTLPGTYDISVTCNMGPGGMGTLIVASSVGPDTGGGSTSVGANRVLLYGGMIMLLLATGGALLLRRRSAGR
jgi:hypothetical protein